MAGTGRSPCSPTGAGESGGHPGGRKRPAQTDEADDERPLTLSTLLAALKENREEIVAQVREDMDGLSNRVTTVEHTMDAHVANTTKLLEAMTDRHCAMEQSVRQVDERQSSVLQRLEVLEGKFASANFSLSSTRTSDFDGGSSRPALVVGGWSADQHHEDTLRLVKQHLQDLDINLDTSKAFVPGLRRGFALVPLTKLDGESDEDQRTRVQEALRTIRAAKVVTGQKPEGGNRYFFAALSQSPERRKRAQMAGKIKRLIIEEGGDIRRIDVEYGTANLWYNSIKIASGVTTPPEGASIEKAGWVHLGALARQIGASEEAEVICDTGKFHATLDELQMLYGRREEDWRGTAIVHTSNLQHTRGKILPCSISCTLTSSEFRIGVFSIHIPHHATLSTTEQILQSIHIQMQTHTKAVIGVDANETFSDAQQNRQIKASSARGEMLLDWFEQQECHFPQQALDKPSHFPYNQRLEPRRLDYVLAKRLLCDPGGVLAQRDIATSDHEPIAVPLTNIHIAPARGGSKPAAWSARTLRDHDEVDNLMNYHASIGGDPVSQLQAASGPPSPTWRRTTTTVETELLENSDWRKNLREHFEKIFFRQKQIVVTVAIGEIMKKLERQCKHTKWLPFQLEDLQAVKIKWRNGKSCGPDMVSHEALKALLPHPVWGNRLVAIFNDMLYTCRIVESIEAGATILLAKTSQPKDWSETRPITLSSVLLKTFGQLLLQRGGNTIQSPARLQWCRRGRQGIELIMILRRLARVARDWGMEFYIAKLDIRKAFDSIYQESLAQHVCEVVGEQANLPWEARAWVALLHAQKITIEVAGESIPIQQSNGVRQGAPESPVAFGSVVAVDLDAAIDEARSSKPAGDDCPPEDGGSYMDDNYIWSTNRKHFQHMLTSLGSRLPKRGLYIHPGKTDIISTSDKPVKFQVAGEDVLTKGPKHIFHVLGSPLSFQGGTAMLLAEAQSRARKAFWSHRVKPPAHTSTTRASSSTDIHHPQDDSQAKPDKPSDTPGERPPTKHSYTEEEWWQYDNAPQGPDSAELEIPPSLPHAEGTTTQYLPLTHGCFEVQITATHYIPTPMTASPGLPPLHLTHVHQTGPVLTAPPFTPGTRGRLAPMGPNRWLSFIATEVPPLDEFWPHSMFLVTGDSFQLEDTPNGWQMTRIRGKAMQRLASAANHDYITYYDIQHDVDIVITWLNGHMHAMATAMDGDPRNWGSPATTTDGYEQGMQNTAEVLGRMGRALQGVQMEPQNREHWLLLVDVAVYLMAVERGEAVSHPADVIAQSRGVVSSHLARERREQRARGVILELRNLRAQLQDWPQEQLNGVHGALLDTLEASYLSNTGDLHPANPRQGNLGGYKSATTVWGMSPVTSDEAPLKTLKVRGKARRSISDADYMRRSMTRTGPSERPTPESGHFQKRGIKLLFANDGQHVATKACCFHYPCTLHNLRISGDRANPKLQA
ncbi:unnamed protein product [Symbiodinium sp. CCMP2592]|nr:unnamed protein product [Symbiodinium sp. CCMP2592]